MTKHGDNLSINGYCCHLISKFEKLASMEVSGGIKILVSYRNHYSKSDLIWGCYDPLYCQ